MSGKPHRGLQGRGRAPRRSRSRRSPPTHRASGGLKYDLASGRPFTRDPIGIDHAFDDEERFNATDLNLYAYAGNNPQSMVDPSGNDAISVGLNLGSAVGVGAGVGGYLEIGFVYNTETGSVDVYGSVASVDGLGAFGGWAGGGISVTDIPNADDFYGMGYETSEDSWWDGVAGANLQQELDEDWSHVGTAGGVSLGLGGGMFAYHTYTGQLLHLRGPTKDRCK